MTRPLDAFWPSHASEPTHEKNYDVAEALGIHPMQAYGHIRAFRTRYPQESPTGKLRGGADQVERLALWDGPRGALAAAFRATGIIDADAEGRLSAHGHDEFVGAVLEHRERARANGAARTQKWRQGKASSPDGGEGDNQGDASRDASSPLTYSLTSLSQNSSQRGSGGEPAAAPAVEPEDQAETQQERAEARYAKRVAGQAYEQHNSKKAAAEAIYGRPQTPRDLLLLEVDGEPLATTWGKRFRALDGKAGRPTLAEVVENLWKYAEAKSWGISGKTVLAWWVNQLAKDNDKFRRAWERDGGTTAVSSDPLWPAWRKLKDDPTKDPGPFEEWKLKREELGMRSGSPKPSGGHQAQQAAHPKQDPNAEPDPAVVEDARAKLAALSSGLLAKPKRPITPTREALDRMLPADLTTNGGSR